MEKEEEIKRGRPRFFTKEERTKNKTNYMLHKEWYCDICNTGRNYTLAGKTCHIKTYKHQKNDFENKNPGLIYVLPKNRKPKPW